MYSIYMYVPTTGSTCRYVLRSSLFIIKTVRRSSDGCISLHFMLAFY
jgi:hypothetical protein